MGNKNHLLIILLLGITGAVLFATQSSQQSSEQTTSSKSITNIHKFLVGDVEIEYKPKTVTQKIDSRNDIVANANSDSLGDIKINNALEEEIESSEVEPTSTNADMRAKGEFSDQINIATEVGSCKELCADNTDVDAPAMGEFSDQINTDVIINEAMLKNPDLQLDVKLAEIPMNSHPPTELGAYTSQSQ